MGQICGFIRRLRFLCDELGDFVDQIAFDPSSDGAMTQAFFERKSGGIGEQRNSGTAEQQNSRTVEQRNRRTAELTNR